MTGIRPDDRVIIGNGQSGKVVGIDFNIAHILLDSGLRMSASVSAIKKTEGDDDSSGELPRKAV